MTKPKSTKEKRRTYYNPSKWKQRKITAGTLASLILWKTHFDKFTSVVQLLIQSDG